LGIAGFLVIGLLLATPAAEAACTGSGATWSCSAGTTTAQVNTALGSATDGATFTFAAGSYSWSSEITLSNTKGVSLICATQDGCTVTVGGPFLTMALSGVNTKSYRLSGFKFQNAPACLCIWIYGNGTLSNFRIDHNTFQNFNSDAIAIFLGETGSAGKFYGLIDHNTFTGSSNFMIMKVLGHGDTNNWGPSPKGTANNMFVEDNTISFSTAANLGAGCMDAWRSAAVVWRHNTTQNCLVTAHGVTHGGMINFEVYENRLIRTAGSGSWEDGTRLFHHQGSGELIAFNNTFTASSGKSSEAISVTHYRSASPSVAGYDSSLGQCNGSSTRDGNRSPTSTFFGYPCWRQPGRDGSQGLQPMYAWGNRWSDTGAKVDLAVENPWGQSSPSVFDHIKPNRDFYNAVSASVQTSPTSPFNGTTGMGVGTLANRPTTCTTGAESGGGVGYFATNQGPQGTLYRCSATNTWTVQYTPYTYPHPLQAGGGGTTTPPPAAPSNVRIIR
jgi:hypothetical protein